MLKPKKGILVLSQLETYIDRAHWLEATHRIPAWDVAGVLHGFEGRGFELPSGAYSLQQIHSATIHEVPVAGEAPAGDGLLTQHPGTRIAVKTADCVPILVHHPRGVLALHAGWRGLADNILGTAIDRIRQRNWPLAEASFAIGPCIGLDSFEVGPEVIAQFRTRAFQLQDSEHAFACSKGRKDRWHLDLGLLALLQLARYAIDPRQVYVIRSCTRKENGIWHSFRRDGTQAGRNWSWIVAASVD